MSKSDKKSKKKDLGKLDAGAKKTTSKKFEAKSKKDSKKKSSSKSKIPKDASKSEIIALGFCPCCKKHCPLSNPKCKKGKKIAEKRADDK